MNDTSPQMAQKMEGMFQQKTPAERLLMGLSMFDLAKQLVRSSILQEKPNASPADLRKELFLRFYGNDFAPVRQQKIIEHLTRAEGIKD